MTENMPTSEVLNLAADLIQTRGWATGGTSDDPWGRYTEGGPVCLEGALMAFSPVARGSRFPVGALERCPSWRAVCDYLNGLMPWEWNDAEGRTADEVIEVLRACAVIEASRERSRILGEPAEDTEKVGHESRSESGVSAFSNHGLDAGAAA